MSHRSPSSRHHREDSPQRRSRARSRRRRTASAAGLAVALSASLAASPPTALAKAPPDYAANLELIRSVAPRNTNHDASPWRSTPQADLELGNHLGPREDYLRRKNVSESFPGEAQPGANPEGWYPVVSGGQFRVACEFSHFAYDDPIEAPGEPGGSHLQMFFGNTDANAYSTYGRLVNSGSSTCNGQEINRTAYWMPALFDGDGNVRIPMRAIVYYKNEGIDKGAASVYPPRAVIVAQRNFHRLPNSEGGVRDLADKRSYQCSNQFRGDRNSQSNTMPDCPGGGFGSASSGEFFRTIELIVKFPYCWNGEDASNPDNWRTALTGNWYSADCQGWTKTPNLEYIVQYQVDAGESTKDWYLASDVDRETLEIDGPRGASIDGSWWGAWREDVNQTWLDECANFAIPGVPTGCGFGFLSDGGPDNGLPGPGIDPKEGPALKFRPQYDRPQDGAPKVAAATLHEQLCPGGRRLDSAEDAAWCTRDDAPTTDPEPPVEPEPPTEPEPPVAPPTTGLPPGQGLSGDYHDSRFFGNRVGTRLDGPLDLDLSRGLPAGSGLDDPNDVSIQWRGYLVPDTSETLTLWTRSDDGVRVYVDGVKVIDNWTAHTATVDTATVTLEAGRAHAIAVQYYQIDGASTLRFGWQRDGEARQLIPKRYLYADYPL